MSNVISIAEVRSARVRRTLASHARNGDSVILETRTELIAAEKIACRERFAEILTGAGDYYVVGYADIRAVRPVALAHSSVVNARGDFLAFHDTVIPTQPVAILPFERRR